MTIGGGYWRNGRDWEKLIVLGNGGLYWEWGLGGGDYGNGEIWRRRFAGWERLGGDLGHEGDREGEIGEIWMGTLSEWGELGNVGVWEDAIGRNGGD